MQPDATAAVEHPRVHAARHPDKPALVIADTGDALTYGELVERADRAAELFARLGLVEGDTIAILLENHIRYPEVCWAAKNSGITYTCLSSQSSVDDAAYIVANCDAKLLLSSAALAEVAVGAATIARAANPSLQLLMIDGAREPFTSYEDRLAATPPVAPAGRRRGPSMLYSSGTTGRPKGVRVPLPDSPPEIAPRRMAMLKERYGLADDTVIVCPGPLYHASPGRFMMSVQRMGGTMISFRRFDAQATLEAIDRHRATLGIFVPTMFVRMLALPDAVRARFDGRSLRCALHLAAPCPIPVKERMIAWWGPIIEELYGGTEAIGHLLISSTEWLTHKGSVGRPATGCRVKICDDEGRELPPMTPGVIWMNNGHRFEYHKDPDKTRGSITDDGWGTLGDIGYLDADGYLYLTDRKAHMIISGGVNIYPQEAENVLYAHPAVEDVAVIGVPHDEMGEEVKAVVQLKATAAPSAALADELIAYCRARLSPVKCPRSVDFVDELPRSEAGKLVKRLVKERYWAGRGAKI
ncbi:MAG TPA: AMP-binding protein [Nevskiaceae bacterium]|nr:AMP-binding protein [Nevskiaceae bacterium]